LSLAFRRLAPHGHQGTWQGGYPLGVVALWLIRIFLNFIA